jgi:hypothetical protein
MFLRSICWLSPDYLWLYSPLLDLDRFFSFLIFYTVGRTPWTGDQLVARPLPKHRTAHTQNKRTHISMPWVGIEPTILVFEWAKTIHDFDRAAGLAVAQAVSHRAPTTATRVQVQARSIGFVVDKVALGQVFSDYFGFPCQFSFHRLLHIHHHLSSGTGAIS